MNSIQQRILLAALILLSTLYSGCIRKLRDCFGYNVESFSFRFEVTETIWPYLYLIPYDAQFNIIEYWPERGSLQVIDILHSSAPIEAKEGEVTAIVVLGKESSEVLEIGKTYEAVVPEPLADWLKVPIDPSAMPKHYTTTDRQLWLLKETDQCSADGISGGRSSGN